MTSFEGPPPRGRKEAAPPPYEPWVKTGRAPSNAFYLYLRPDSSYQAIYNNEQDAACSMLGYFRPVQVLYPEIRMHHDLGFRKDLGPNNRHGLQALVPSGIWTLWDTQNRFREPLTAKVCHMWVPERVSM